MNSFPVASLLWFAAIVVMIPLALWLLKRTPLGGAGSGDMLRSVAALPLSTSQRILTVEVGQGEQRRWLVLGVTPHSITTLHTMEPPPASDASVGAAGGRAVTPFAQMMGRLRGQAPGGEDAR